MNLKFLIGVATGVGLTLFFQSSKSKRVLQGVGEKISDGLLAAEDVLYDATDKVESLREKVIEKTSQA